MYFTATIRSRLFWIRTHYFTPKNFIILMAILVGIFAGVAAIILKSLVHTVESLLPDQAPAWVYAFLPLIGILITVFLSQNVFKEPVGHGVSSVLYSIAQKGGILSRVKMYSRLITAAITVGFGGSTGLEAPIVVTGSAIGSNLTRWFRMDEKKRILFIGCGTAAGIAAVFDSPVAGVLFALEVILPEFTLTSFIPVLISGVTASFLSKGISGDIGVFSYPYTEEYHLKDVPLFIVLGLLLGLISVYFTRTTRLIENNLKKLPFIYFRATLGGIILGALLFLFPPLLGEGYIGIRKILEGNAQALTDKSFLSTLPGLSSWLWLYLLALALIKVVTMSLTIGAGGAGGTFAPSMIVGGLTGSAFARILNQSGWVGIISETNFTLIGMAGVLSGVMHAPLTGMFLIAEITDGYSLILPLMLVCVTAYICKTYFEPYSLHTRDLILKGEFIRGNKDKEILSHLQLDTILETDLPPVPANATLRDLIKIISQSKRNIFPVINSNHNLLGVIILNDIRQIMFSPEVYDTTLVEDLMQEPPILIQKGDSMEIVMKKFEDTKAWNLPVMEGDKYLGFVSKSSIFSLYRQELIQVGKDMTA